MRLMQIGEGFGLRGQGEDPARYTLYYRPTDRDNDLIKIQPVLRATALKQLLSSHTLPDFTGTVYIGFEIVSAREYKDAPIRQLRRPFRVLQHLGGDLDITGEQAFTLSQQLLDPRKYGLHGVQQDERLAHAYGTVAGLVQRILGQEALSKRLSFLVTEINSSGQRIHDLAYELAQRLKRLEPGEGRVTEQFLGLATALVQKLPGRPAQYDYIVYPQSSSQFNAELAQRIAAVEGAVVQQISKLPARQVQVDSDQLYQRALQLAPNKLKPRGYEVGSGANLKYYPTPESFAQAWATAEQRKLQRGIGQGTKPPSIKNVAYQDKRRYAKLYDPSGLQEIGDYEGNVLIIDDNIVSGGTVELLHELLSKLSPPPRQIDIFIPLRVP